MSEKKMEMLNLPLDPISLEKKIGHTFKDKELLVMALTHSSYSNELKVKKLRCECNERLEFLGDSVLSIIVSEYLFMTFPDWPEGNLTRMRADVVCEKALSKFATEIGLGNYLLLGHGEEKSNGRERKSILADAFEALLAAIYIDSGADGKKNVSAFLMPHIIREVASYQDKKSEDYKTALQQIIQQADGERLEYVTVSESGPDHMKTFTVEARLNSNVIGHGVGKTKREAEQNAAKEALELFGE